MSSESESELELAVGLLDSGDARGPLCPSDTFAAGAAALGLGWPPPPRSASMSTEPAASDSASLASEPSDASMPRLFSKSSLILGPAGP